MPKDPSPLLGYNNNIRHKSRVFHVQTEDSGVRHPHIITHLFMDGGRILKSVKTSYADHLGAEKMADVVRLMMKEQHKAMLMALRDGQYDTLVEGGAAAMLLEHEMTANTLLETLSGLLTNREKLGAMAASARTFAHPQAAARIAEMVAGLASTSAR